MTFRNRNVTFTSIVLILISYLPALAISQDFGDQANLPQFDLLSPNIESVTIYGEISDGEIINQFCDNWTECRNSSTANTLFEGYQNAYVDASYDPGIFGPYLVKRILSFFDTSVIPSDAQITNVSFNVFAGEYLAGNNSIHVVPSNADLPLDFNDFGKIQFVTGGSGTAEQNSWLKIDLSSEALTWINKNGITKLALIHHYDLYNIVPSEQNSILLAMAENTLNRPYLSVEYNPAPTISGLDDQSFDQDHLPPRIIDLWDYAEDAETPDSELVFTIDGSPPPGAGVGIVDNRWLIIDPSFNWCGYTDITVRVTDPGGLWDEDPFRVAVTWSCQGPLPVPDQTAPQDQPITLDLTEFEPQVGDGTGMVWYVTGEDHCTVSGELSEYDVLTFTPQLGFVGNDTVTLHMTYPWGGEVTQELMLTWSDVDSISKIYLPIAAKHDR